MLMKRGRRGRLYTLSGPSGSGKTSLCVSLLGNEPNLRLSISCTTRTKRPGEIEGKSYHFISVKEFQEQSAQDAFLEQASVHGNLYGTRLDDVETVLAKGDDLLLEIDWQGARQVAEKLPDVCRIFILPPSMRELQSRLQSRGQDSIEIIDQRLASAYEEINHADEAEFLIINSDFDQSLDELRAIIHAHRLRTDPGLEWKKKFC